MTKTLIYIPRMFTGKEFKELVGEIPKDFDKTTKDFWKYIIKRLKAVSRRVRWVYSDSLLKNERKTYFRREESAIIKELDKNSVQILAVGDPTLASEVKAWLEMTKTSSSTVVFELYEESLREMSKHVMDVVNKTLKNEEIGVLFIDSSLKISFHKDMRVIRMFPFNPQDYLNRYRVKLRT